MAEGTSPQAIADAISWTFALVVMTVSGIAIRLGWVKSADKTPERHVEVVSINAQAMGDIADRFAKATQRLLEMHEDSVRRDKRVHDVLVELSDDVRDLTQQIRKLVE